MNHQTDSELLRSYADSRAESAFAELVRRHVDFVYSAASRMVRDPHLAEDVTQGVFVALAKSAPELADRATLSGWLHQTARNIAAQTVRTIVRRRTREQEAVTMNQLLASATEPAWEQIAPHLDAALGELSESDRDAVLLRYFEKKSANEIGQRLGLSDVAAQKRVSRGVEKLREYFAKHGVAIGAGALVVVISANAVQAAPIALAATISTAALAGTAVSTTAISTAVKTIAMTTLQKTVITAALVTTVGAGIFEAKQAARARAEAQALQQQQAPLAAQIQQLQHERDGATNQAASLAEDLAKIHNNNDELIRLRGEITTLKNANAPSADDSTKNAAQAWLDRVNRLKDWIAQNPQARIPEFKFLTEQDWLDTTINPIDSDNDYRQAAGILRNFAANKVATDFYSALKEYQAANPGQFPTDLSQLTPFLNPPLDDSILSGWDIEPAGNFKNQPGMPKGDFVITEKEAVDEATDYRWMVSENGANNAQWKQSPDQIIQGLAPLLDAVGRAYAAANGGQMPKNPMDAVPYATTPEQRAALQTVIQLHQQNLPPATNQNGQ